MVKYCRTMKIDHICTHLMPNYELDFKKEAVLGNHSSLIVY